VSNDETSRVANRPGFFPTTSAIFLTSNWFGLYRGIVWYGQSQRPSVTSEYPVAQASVSDSALAMRHERIGTAGSF
jgi:hypothetical protein